MVGRRCTALPLAIPYKWSSFCVKMAPRSLPKLILTMILVKTQPFITCLNEFSFSAAEKCEELDEGYVNCTEYLYGTQVIFFLDFKMVNIFRKNLVSWIKHQFMLFSTTTLKAQMNYLSKKEIFSTSNVEEIVTKTNGGGGIPPFLYFENYLPF